jgi:hypothetical protein
MYKICFTYGSESCTLTEVNEAKLKIFERKILRKIYCPSYINGVWRIKYDELHTLFREPNIVQSMKID